MLASIQALSERLSKSEQKVARAVLAEPALVLNRSAAQLAEQAGVSAPTVIRFCRTLNCHGFRDFKLRLAQELGRHQKIRYDARELPPSDSPAAALAATVIDGAIGGLERLRQQLDPALLLQAIALLANARRVEFYGLGGNAVVATDAQLKFFRLGIAAVAYADAYIHNISATLLRPNDVAVAVSHSGRSKDLLRSAELARQAGAKVIAITASDSPLARRATLTLPVNPPGQRPTTEADDLDVYAPIKARIAPMVVIDILAVGVALERGPQVVDRLEELREVLQDKFVAG